MRIAIDAFRGVRPRLDPRLLNPQEAQIAENCRLWSGAVGAWKKSLSVFSGATNWLLFSERFDNAAWTQSALVDVQANVTAAPDGTNLADKLRENNTNATHSVRQSIVKPAGVAQWTGAVSLKAAERTFAFVQVDDSVNSALIIVNLSTGAITQQTATGGFAILPQTSAIAEANGFFRVSLCATTTASTTLRMVIGPALNGTTPSYAGTTNSGIYVFGASLRQRGVPGPYTATEALAFTVDPVSFYLFKLAYWFLYPALTYTEKLPYAGDTADMTGFTRAGIIPQYTYSPQAEDVALRTVMPRHSFALGLPVPANPPLATLAPRSGNITALTTTLGAVASNATTSFTISGITPDGSKVRAACTFSVTVPAGTGRTGNVRFKIARGAVIIAQAELPIDIPVGTTSVTIPYTLEGDETAYPGGALTYTFSATVTANSGAFGAITYAHTLANVRYTKTLVTSNGHGLVKGSFVTIAAVVGADALNGTGLEVLDVPNANTFWVDQDAKGLTYTSGGTWTEAFPQDEAQDTAYVVTFLCTVGAITFEGPPSAASNIVARGDVERVNLTAIPTAAPVDGNTYNVTGKRLYRTNANSDGLNAVYQFVAEIPLANATYTDALRSFELGEELASKDWVKPPADMTGLINVTAGVLAGYSASTLCFSQPFQPHAWPLKYQFTFDAVIVALCAFGNATAVLTQGRPAIVYGTVPGEMRVERSQVARPCVSAKSVADMGYGVVYASDNGLVFMSGAGEKVITDQIFTKSEWESLNPETIIGGAYDDRYVGFYTKDDGTKAGFVLDPQNEAQSWAPLTFGADACWTDPKTGHFYVLIDESIARWDAHPTDTYFYRWRSKRFASQLSGNLSHARLIADRYPIDFAAYVNSDPRAPEALLQVYTKTVTNGLPFPMPGGFRATAFEFEFHGRGDGRLKSFTAASSMDELNQNG